MNPQTILLYDGSFDGFLCCVFWTYNQKTPNPIIQKDFSSTNQLFSITEQIETDTIKAKRVWSSFQKLTSKVEQRNIFKAFLSEIKGVENTILNYMQSAFLSKQSKGNIDYGNKDILKISQVARMVNREKHRMEAFVRFKLTKDNLYVSVIEPDFNVLPLIIYHFKDRYADQKWIIYDAKRKYGIHYDLNTVELITFDHHFNTNHQVTEQNLDHTESDFQELWSTYYKNVNIKSRKNTKLHRQHIPKRYWKHLTEKNIIR